MENEQDRFSEDVGITPEHRYLLRSGITEEELDSLSLLDAIELYQTAREEMWKEGKR